MSLKYLVGRNDDPRSLSTLTVIWPLQRGPRLVRGVSKCIGGKVGRVVTSRRLAMTINALWYLPLLRHRNHIRVGGISSSKIESTHLAKGTIVSRKCHPSSTDRVQKLMQSSITHIRTHDHIGPWTAQTESWN